MLLTSILCVIAACVGYNSATALNERATQLHIMAPIVARSVSGTFMGTNMVSRRGVRFQAFRGIRYAEPPKGNLRFQPPILKQKYSAPVQATEEGPACPQPVDDDYQLNAVDEDCLRLNVYTTDVGRSNLPVVVFIHAGGFYSVSGRSDVAGPEHLLDREIVLVTINYRLGTLGFISTGDKYAPGNLGLKDQVAALKWVQRNIAAFGGDPELVTLAGYSAGAFSVMLHMVSPMSKGLFHRAISMSGSPISQMVIPKHQKHLAERQAKLLNCSTTNSKVIIDCLKSKTAKELGDSLNSMFEFGYDPVILWKPIQEQDFGQERFLVEQPLKSICKGHFHSVPYIISQTQDEFFWKAFNVLNNATMFEKMRSDWQEVATIAFHLSGDTESQADTLKEAYLGQNMFDNDTVTADALGKLYSDSIIGFGVHRLSNIMARNSRYPVYYYEFAYSGNYSHSMDTNTNKPMGVAHHDDLIYLFNISAVFPSIPWSDSKDSHMIEKMTAIWYNFMRYGDPNPRGDTPELQMMQWPPLKPVRMDYLKLADHFSVKQNLFSDRFEVWEDLYPLDYSKCGSNHDAALLAQNH